MSEEIILVFNNRIQFCKRIEIILLISIRAV